MGTASTVFRSYLSTSASAGAGATGYNVDDSGHKYNAGTGATAVHVTQQISDVVAELTSAVTLYHIVYNASGATRTYVCTDDETSAFIYAECAYI